MQQKHTAETAIMQPASPLTVVIGATINPDRYAYKAATSLLAHGHRIHLVGVKQGNIQGHTINPDLTVSVPVDTVTLYIGPDKQPAYYQAVMDLNPRRLIFNPGTENPEFETLARNNGIETIQACTLVLLSTDQY